MTLDIGEDRILLETRSNVYLLDIFLPFNIVQEEVGAQFNKKNEGNFICQHCVCYQRTTIKKTGTQLPVH